MTIKIKETGDYSLFDSYEVNRVVNKQTKRYRRLKASMKKYGWIPAHPLHVVPGPGGRLKIKAGHHRFAAAVELKIPVRYVVCNDNGISIYELESPSEPWNTKDFLDSYAKGGNKTYVFIKEYCQRTGVGLSAALSLFNGYSGASYSTNISDKIKDGTFEIKDYHHPEIVAALISAAGSAGFAGAANRNFVAALSKVVKTAGVDLDRLKAKMKAHPYLFQKCASVDAYLAMLEEIYNRQRSDKVPLAFLANSAARARNAVTPKQAGQAA